MDRTEPFLTALLNDPEDVDLLLELASFVRGLIGGNQTADLSRILRFTVEHNCFEAFSWCMELLGEAAKMENCPPEPFECALGRAIPDYDELIRRLGVDLKIYENSAQTLCDSNGEVVSFFNIFRYETAYPGVFLVSAENFDTRDNDYVQYSIAFVR